LQKARNEKRKSPPLPSPKQRDEKSQKHSKTTNTTILFVGMYDAKHDDDDMKKKKKKKNIRKRSSSRRYEKLPYVLHVHYTSLP